MIEHRRQHKAGVLRKELVGTVWDRWAVVGNRLRYGNRRSWNRLEPFGFHTFPLERQMDLPSDSEKPLVFSRVHAAVHTCRAGRRSYQQ